MQWEKVTFKHAVAGNIDREYPQIDVIDDLTALGDEQTVVRAINVALDRLAQQMSYAKTFTGGQVNPVAHFGADHGAKSLRVTRSSRPMGKAAKGGAKRVSQAVQAAILKAVADGRDVAQALQEALTSLGIDT